MRGSEDRSPRLRPLDSEQKSAADYADSAEIRKYRQRHSVIVTLPWHLVGIMGQPRRMADYDSINSASATGRLLIILGHE